MATIHVMAPDSRDIFLEDLCFDLKASAGGVRIELFDLCDDRTDKGKLHGLGLSYEDAEYILRNLPNVIQTLRVGFVEQVSCGGITLSGFCSALGRVVRINVNGCHDQQHPGFDGAQCNVLLTFRIDEAGGLVDGLTQALQISQRYRGAHFEIVHPMQEAA